MDSLPSDLETSNILYQVLDLDSTQYQSSGWGRVTLWPEFHGGWNQRWQFIQGEIECKGTQFQLIPYLRLDVWGAETGNGAKVGVYQRTGSHNQRWTLQGSHGGHGGHVPYGGHVPHHGE